MRLNYILKITMIKIGQYNTLRIVRFTDHGAYLDAGKELGDILLPKQYVKPEMRQVPKLRLLFILTNRTVLLQRQRRR